MKFINTHGYWMFMHGFGFEGHFTGLVLLKSDFLKPKEPNGDTYRIGIINYGGGAGSKQEAGGNSSPPLMFSGAI